MTNIYSNYNQTKLLSKANVEIQGDPAVGYKVRFLANDFWKTATKWVKAETMGGGGGETFFMAKLPSGTVHFTLKSSLCS